MTDITKAITAARKALARLREHDGGTRYNGDDDDAGERACCLVASWKPHDSDCPHAVAVAEFDRLLSALDAAQGEAVLGSVQSGSVTIPFWVIDYAQKIELFMKVNGVDAWALGGIQSRDLPPPQAPPAAVPAEGLRDSALNSAKFRASCYALVGIVEGIAGLGRRWASGGERLKDTPEWVAFYNSVSAMRNGTAEPTSATQAPPAAVPAQEPLFLLHTGTIYGNERGDWEVETNSGWGVDVDIYCDANPGRTVGLYLAAAKGEK